MKSIAQQEKDAEIAYKQCLQRHPHSSRTTVLWYRWRDLKTKLIRVQLSTERSSTPSSQDGSGVAA